jgi:hypothetical protein
LKTLPEDGFITEAPQAVSISADTAPPWITPVSGSPISRGS